MKREKICIITAFIMAFIITGALVHERGLLVEARAEQAQENLAKEVLRFHVLANSDSEADQELKMQVKEAVILYMKKQLPKEADLVETKEWVQTHLEEIQGVAAQTLQSEGSDYLVEAELETVLFPKKTYGDVTFPAGEYEALRIEIGEAKGQNWWCCLYPNLCFLDSVHAVVPEEGKQELEQVLDEDGYQMVTANSDFKIKWFFFGGNQ